IINIRWATEDPNPKVQAINKRKATEMAREAIEARLPSSIHQIQHLPGSEELELAAQAKRRKGQYELDSGPTTGEVVPRLYIGAADGQYYYNYGTYGYNHETQQYDPARIDGYVAPEVQATSQNASTLQDQVKASLQASIQSTKTTKVGSTGSVTEAKQTAAPVKSALSALASYGSDSESEDEE
ncbi:hypothetical protein BGZ94_005638, partial [Podila epigama]